MKNILKFLSVVFVLSVTVIACDEEETTFNPLSFPNDAFVTIAGSSANLSEASTTPIEVVVNYSNATAAATSPITVDFSISGATAGTDYTILDGKSQFTFAAGVFSDKIEIMPVNNIVEDGNKILTITLDSSTASLGFPGPAGNGTTMTLTIQDDDCAFSLQGLGDASWTGVDNVPASQAGPNDSQISTSFDGTNLLIEGIGYGWITDTAFWNEVVVVSNPVIVQMDLITGDFTIDEQFLCTTTWLGDQQDDYSVRGTGTYTSCTETMVITYDLLQGGGVLRSFSETITIN